MLGIITSQQNSEKVCFLRTNVRKLASLLAGLAICFHLLAVGVCHLPAVAAVVPHPPVVASLVLATISENKRGTP
jgi:hypothetical protein